MRTLTTIAITALLATACAEPGTDDTTDAISGRDTVALDTTPTGAPAPGAAPAPGRNDAPAPDRPAAPADEPEGPADEDRSDVVTTIPAAFHGEWNADLGACGTGTSETRLRISADRVRFYESAGTVRRVEMVNRRVIDVTAEYQGEGETWRDERRFALSEDGNSLTVSGLVRYRCP